jgi:hypothetical protein
MKSEKRDPDGLVRIAIFRLVRCKCLDLYRSDIRTL